MSTEKTPTEARQGQVTGTGRRVLLPSLLLIGLLFILFAIFGPRIF